MGHSPIEQGKPGENILCAAVSALTQSLVIHLKKRNNVKALKMEKGYLEFEISNPGNNSNIASELVLEGLLDLEIQYPELIKTILKR